MSGEAAALDVRELRGLRFSCLEGCGYCCTFTPEVSEPELARLRAKFPALPVVHNEGQLHLAFQGGCGACTLLDHRRCSAYEERPAHCRYFPFHVHFGPEPEVLVNRSCRGVEPAADADLSRQFEEQVGVVAPRATWLDHARTSRSVYARFEAKARIAGAWGDADEAAAGLLAQGPTLLTPEGFAAAAGGTDAVVALLEDSWEPFSAADPVGRPFYLTKDLRWLCFRTARSLLAVEEMQEDGHLTASARLARPAGVPRLAQQVLRGLHDVLAHLVGRQVFRGQVYAAVDALAYKVTVAQAARARLLGLGAELLLRAAILRALGVPEVELAAEAWRFEDSAFLDHASIGAWL